MGPPGGPAQSADRQPHRSRHERTVTESERVPKAIPFLQVASSVAQPGGRGADPVPYPAGRHASIGPAERSASAGKIDVFVVKEVRVVEAAGCLKELGAEQNGAAGERSDGTGL